jgi:hypothetical protein
MLELTKDLGLPRAALVRARAFEDVSRSTWPRLWQVQIGLKTPNSRQVLWAELDGSEVANVIAGLRAAASTLERIVATKFEGQFSVEIASVLNLRVGVVATAEGGSAMLTIWRGSHFAVCLLTPAEIDAWVTGLEEAARGAPQLLSDLDLIAPPPREQG